MSSQTSIKREAAEDIFYGQVVVNWARWFVIAAGIVLVLINEKDPTDLAWAVSPFIVLVAMNFYLHGRRLAQKPANAGLVIASSIVDLVLIMTVVMLGMGSDDQGLDNQFYVAVFPVVLAFAFVMPRRISLGFTALAVLAYAAVCLLAPEIHSGVDGVIDDSAALESLVTRLIVIGSVGGLGTYFWRIERDRRHAIQSR